MNAAVRQSANDLALRENTLEKAEQVAHQASQVARATLRDTAKAIEGQKRSDLSVNQLAEGNAKSALREVWIAKGEPRRRWSISKPSRKTGFGSLNADDGSGTLDQVRRTLTDPTGQGQARAVGLILHIAMVKEALPNGFQIDKTRVAAMSC